MSAVVIAGDTSGTVSLTAPLVAGSVVVTLPGTSGTMAVSGAPSSFTDLAYTGTFTGGTGVVNLGSGQFYKDASGNVGIGTSSPATKLQVAGEIRSNNDISNSSDVTFYSYNGAAAGTVQAGIQFVGSGQNVRFYTASTERMRIDSSGNLLVGTTATINSSRFTVQNGSAGANNCTSVSGIAGTSYHWIFTNPNGNVGTISTNGSLTSYTITSDRRLKENIAPLTAGLASVLSLKPSEYNYISDKETIIQGFIADELQSVVPHAVNGEKDAVDAEGKPIYQSVDSSFLIPHLVSAIQELNATVTAQQALITTMQAKLKDAGVLGF